MTAPALVFPATPSGALGRGDWEAWFTTNAWPSPASLPELAPSFFHSGSSRHCPTAEQRTAMALYALVDAFWRVQRWLEDQGPDALVSWRMEAESTWTGLDDDYALTPRQCLVIDLLPARGNMVSYRLEEEVSKEMASAIQGLTGHDLPHAVWDASIPLEQRMEQMLGPSFLPIHRAQRLEKDLPPPARSTVKPRF